MKLKSLYIFLFIFLFKQVKAQDNTMYLFHDVPQTLWLNPAIQYDCRKFIGLPVISSIKFAYNNSSFAYSDFIQRGSGLQQDSFIINFENIYDKLRKYNYASLEFETDILTFGFRYKEYYLSFGISNKSLLRIDYTKDIVITNNGNWNSKEDIPVNRDLSGTKLNMFNYFEFSAGISRMLKPNLSVGVRFKYLNGGLNISTKKSELQLHTTDNPMTISIVSDYQINTSIPANVETDQQQKVTAYDIQTDKIGSNLIFTGNHGFSFDAGAIYQYNKKLVISASVIDIGFIYWASNINNFTAQNNFSFSGIDFTNYQNGLNQSGIIQTIKDSLNNQFYVKTNQEKYFALLPTKFFVGATYELSEKYIAGFTSKIILYNHAIFPSFTLSINTKPFDFLNISLSNSFINNTLFNFGFGLVIKKGMFQFYAMTDHIPFKYVKEVSSGILLPYSSRTFNFRFGINLLFDCKGDNDNNQKNKSIYCPAYR